MVNVGLGLCFLLTNLTLDIAVQFVAHQNGHSLVVSEIFEDVYPDVDVLKSVFVSDIEDEDCTVGIADVSWYEASKLFLSCGVPELETIDQSLIDNIFHNEVDAYCFLHYDVGTARLGSKVCCANLSMMADFPTELGPRKTILYLTSHSLVLSSNMY